MRIVPRFIFTGLTAALAAAVPVALVFAGPAGAATLTSGPVTLTTTTSVTAGTPYSSGQVINISVVANTTMDQASLEAAGYTSGAVAIKAEECADPGGLAANLPTKTSDCQFDTVQSIPGANVDGSFNISNYTVYALPNNITFGEGTGGPTCDATDECVIGLFANQNDFTKPHIFSAAFYVQPNADDGGESPGDGTNLGTPTPEAPYAIALPLAALAIGGGALARSRRKQRRVA